jgi:predicted dinucleotide-binding enzyme
MKIGILGTGVVGATLGTKLVECGHTVKMGSRTADNPKAVEWASRFGDDASFGTFADAAIFGDVVFLCTTGSVTLEVLRMAKPDNFKNKIVIDVTNPLNFSQKSGPSLYISGGMDSLAEQVQRTLPSAYVVKTLNTVNTDVMVAPERLNGVHDMFVAGNDEAAKSTAIGLLRDCFGWQHIVDLGDLTGARAMEGYLLLWIRLWNQLGTSHFNIHIVKES